MPFAPAGAIGMSEWVHTINSYHVQALHYILYLFSCQLMNSKLDLSKTTLVRKKLNIFCSNINGT